MQCGINMDPFIARLQLRKTAPKPKYALKTTTDKQATIYSLLQLDHDFKYKVEELLHSGTIIQHGVPLCIPDIIIYLNAIWLDKCPPIFLLSKAQ